MTQLSEHFGPAAGAPLCGVLNLYKPSGLTSNDAVVRIRRCLPRGTKVGHGGTLDPDATGCLPILIGRATRLFDVLLEKEKEYEAVLRLGVETATQDASGETVAVREVTSSAEDVRAALPAFVGNIRQVPPMVSALKHNGQRLYDLARAGVDVDRPAREVVVRSLELVEACEPHVYRLRVVCGRGTYVRTICHDIGQVLGCGGHMVSLCRTRCGQLSAGDALPLDEATERAGAGSLPLLPMDAVLNHVPLVRAMDEDMPKIRNGSSLPTERVICEGGESGLHRLYCQEQLCALVEVRDGRWKIKTMLL